MERDTRSPGVDRDGIRVFEKGNGRRAARLRVVVGVVVTAVVGIVGVTVMAVVVLRRAPATHAPLERAATPPPVREERQVAAQPAVPVVPVVVRAVPKVAPAPVAPPAIPNRRATVANRSPDRGTAGSATNRAPANPPSDAAGDRAPDSAAAEQQHRRLESLARDVIEGLKASGETGGLAAFPPPGTVPVKIGLVVPDDFELPQGYIRYYQITDDGARLEPILMFSPDYEFVDANGAPLTVPKDGVVPPEMAPPGLPQRMLDPKTRTAGANSHGPGS